jgi:hypothetical protein
VWSTSVAGQTVRNERRVYFPLTGRKLKIRTVSVSCVGSWVTLIPGGKGTGAGSSPDIQPLLRSVRHAKVSNQFGAIFLVYKATSITLHTILIGTTFLLHSRNGFGLNRWRRTTCPNYDIFLVSLAHIVKLRQFLKVGHDHFLTHPFQFIVPPITFSAT